MKIETQITLSQDELTEAMRLHFAAQGLELLKSDYGPLFYMSSPQVAHFYVRTTPQAVEAASKVPARVA